MSRQDVIDGLKSIADLPAGNHGDFDARTVEIAKAALDLIEAQAASANSIKAEMGAFVKAVDGCDSADDAGQLAWEYAEGWRQR